MTINSLFKFQTIVAIVVFALTLNVQAQTVQCPAGQVSSPTTTNGVTTYSCVQDSRAAACTAAKTAISEASRTLGRYSPTVVERAATCEDAEARAGIGNITNDDDDLDDEAIFDSEEDEQRAQRCQAVVTSGCSEITEADPAKLLSDARKEEADAKKDALEAQQNLAKQIKGINRRITQNQQREKDAERAYQLEIEKISKDLEAQNKSADQELRKAVGQARAAMTAKQAELSGLGDQQRAAELKVAASTTRWEASCRIEANAKLESTKKEQKDEETRAKAAREQRNFSGSSLAGATNRKKATKLREQQLNYNNAYKDCLAGTSPSGAAAKNAIEDAKNELAAAKASLTEKRGVLQQQINDMMKDLIDQQTATAENKDTIKKMAETRLNAATIARTSAQERAATERQELQEDLVEAQTFGNQSVQLAMTASNNATGLVQQAELRNQCNGNRRVTSEDANRNYEKYNAINEAVGVKAQICAESLADCPADLTNACRETTTNRSPTPNAPARSSGPSAE